MYQRLVFPGQAAQVPMSSILLGFVLFDQQQQPQPQQQQQYIQPEGPPPSASVSQLPNLLMISTKIGGMVVML